MILSTVSLKICMTFTIPLLSQIPLHIIVLSSLCIIFRVLAIFFNCRFFIIISYSCSSILFLLPLENPTCLFFDTFFIVQSSNQGRLCVLYISLCCFFMSLSEITHPYLRRILLAGVLLRLLFIDFSLLFSTPTSYMRELKSTAQTHVLTTNNSLHQTPFGSNEIYQYLNSYEDSVPLATQEWGAFLNPGTSGRRLMTVSTLPQKLLSLNNINTSCLQKFTPYTDSFMFSTRAQLFQKGYAAKDAPFKDVVKFMSYQHQRDEISIALSACLLEKYDLTQILYQKFNQTFERILTLEPSGASSVDLLATVRFTNGNDEKVGLSITATESVRILQQKRDECSPKTLLVAYTRNKLHMKNVLSLSDESFLSKGKLFFPEFETIQTIINDKKNTPKTIPSDTPIIVPVSKLYEILKKL